MLSGQVSWLAGHRCCPAFPKPSGFSDFIGQRLAAYSCGGSAGIRPASLLAPDQCAPENLDENQLSEQAAFRQPLGTASFCGSAQQVCRCGSIATIAI